VFVPPRWPGPRGPPMPETLASLLSPAESIAEEWVARVRRDMPTNVPDDDGLFLTITRGLVQHLEDGEPLRCPEAIDMSVHALTVLRQIAHERIAAADDAKSIPDLLTRCDSAIDALVVECVEGRMRHLELDALIDPLTGAGNRRALERDLRLWLAQAVRYEHELSIVVVDLDGLKAVNDVQGHEAGDALLRQLATTFAGGLRAGDGFYRLGGDEFVAVLPHATTEDAEKLVERARRDAPPFSAGVATSPDDGSAPSLLLDVADQRLIRHRGPRTRRRTTPEATKPRPTPRSDDALVVSSVTTSVTADSTSVEVLIRQGDVERAGRASGPGLSIAEPTIAARATLDALSGVGYEVGPAHVQTAEVRRLGDQDVVTVMIWSRSGDVEVLGTGTTPVRRGVAEAAARAVVQAMAPVLPARQVIQV
jgi:diguanylate cyclase (GGDEF)-like protein